MNITLKASIKAHRDLARLFEKDKHGSKILGTNGGEFVLAYSSDWIQNKNEITIDTTVNQPCIYQCMKEGLKVKVTFSDRFVRIFNFNNNYFKKLLFEYIAECGEIKYIKILDTDKMQGVEVTE